MSTCRTTIRCENLVTLYSFIHMSRHLYYLCSSQTKYSTTPCTLVQFTFAIPLHARRSTLHARAVLARAVALNSPSNLSLSTR